MICTRCKRRSDWPGEDSHWRTVSDAGASAVRPLLVCGSCEHQQWFS